jgi:acetyl esterase/lipase
MAQHAAPDDRLTALVLFSPWTDLSISGASAGDPATRDPVFQSGFLEGLARSYLGGADPRDPRASPLFGALDALPPIQIQVGTEERLLDDSVRLAKQAARPGAIVRLDVFESLYHVFQRDVGTLKTAGMALDMAARFIVEHSSSAD